MSRSWRDLKRYWIIPGDPYGPLGFGVTAFSLDDALGILGQLGYALPEDPGTMTVIEDVAMDALLPGIRWNMRPTAVRGLWYPFWIVGVPEERRRR